MSVYGADSQLSIDTKIMNIGQEIKKNDSIFTEKMSKFNHTFSSYFFVLKFR